MVLRIGHRGAMGYAPENTLLSFHKALELHCDMVELDVWRCKSGELVVIHDETLDRTTNGTGLVAEKTRDYLKTLDAGGGEKIPLLTEVLDCINGRARINIELKGLGTAGPVSKLVGLYRKSTGLLRGSILISSFDCEELSAFRKLDRDTSIGILIEKEPAGLFDFARAIRAYSLNVSLPLATPQIISRTHQEGMKVFVWTVDEEEEIARMKGLGVDGIFSNFPDRI